MEEGEAPPQEGGAAAEPQQPEPEPQQPEPEPQEAPAAEAVVAARPPSDSTVVRGTVAAAVEAAVAAHDGPAAVAEPATEPEAFAACPPSDSTVVRSTVAAAVAAAAAACSEQPEPGAGEAAHEGRQSLVAITDSKVEGAEVVELPEQQGRQPAPAPAVKAPEPTGGRSCGC
jgi:hypothetical protein